MPNILVSKEDWDRLIGLLYQSNKMVESAKPKWISAKERLPEKYEPCLVWYEYYHYKYERVCPEYGIGFYAPQIEAWCGDPSTGKDVKVLYWMPLPEPPEKGGGEDG